MLRSSLSHRRWTALIVALVTVLTMTFLVDSNRANAANGPYATWPNGLTSDESFFPIAVWLQSPHNAARYKELGINLYIGLWKGPTAAQLEELGRHGMPVICDQNEFALGQLNNNLIVGWMHGDEPDNAQAIPGGKGYGPPIPPQKIFTDYQKIRRKDPTRPVILNLGQGVAWDGWHGRGIRTNHPEDYPEYARGCDIVSFDIYPAVHSREAVAGKLWYVPYGVRRLRQWTSDRKPVWNCIECTHIGNPNLKPTPAQVKAEVWMALIHGSRGLIYFVHQFKPRFVEAGLLADPVMADAVGKINRQIQGLAPVLNSPTVTNGATAIAVPDTVSAELARLLGPAPIAMMLRRHGNNTYLFAVRMEGKSARATFAVEGLPSNSTAEVLGEQREIAVRQGVFQDDFGPYAVHIYKIRQ